MQAASHRCQLYIVGVSNHESACLQTLHRLHAYPVAFKAEFK